MIYGANGYTGQLIAQEAARRGMRPILAGRDSDAITALAAQLHLPHRVLSLDAPDALRQGLAGVGLVLHCAGPFSATCGPMLEACLDGGSHYLDITGEIDVFAHCHSQHLRARDKGVVVLPGAGFDVVPTDCLAAQLKREMPGATSLVLAFEAAGGPSPGTARTGVEGLGAGGRVRIDGKLVVVPLAWKTRKFDRDGEPRFAMTIPWGDVYTAHVSTGIPDIEVYMGVSPASARRLQRLRWLGPLLATRPLQAWLKSQVSRRIRGPSEGGRARSGATVWGEVSDAAGDILRAQLRTPNGYELTVSASLGIVARLLGGESPQGGYYTPSMLMGADYVLGLPGVTRH